LALIVHCSDISHPAKEWVQHQHWTELVVEEFFKQVEELLLILKIEDVTDMTLL